MSDRLVIDSSVVVKWYVAEHDSAEAAVLFRLWMNDDIELFAPDLLPIEVGNILWKKQRIGAMTSIRAEQTTATVTALTIPWSDSHVLLPQATSIAIKFDRTVYDSIYLALAVQLGCPFVTADDRLANAVAPHIPNVVKLSDWKPSPPATAPPATPSSP